MAQTRSALVVTATLGLLAGAAAADAVAPPDAEAAAACPTDAGAPATDSITLKRVAFGALPNWASDKHAEAIPAFLASCARLADIPDDDPVGHDGHSGKARQWRRACAAAAKLPAGDDTAARAFFEAEFHPYQAAGRAGAEGKMTSYYVQSLRASRRRHGAYQTPILARPADLVSVDLSSFVPDGRGRKVWGKLDPRTGALRPYPTRAEIRKGALAGQNLELLWADDPVDALFTEIEGSGRATLDDGSEVWLEFAGKNGRPYSGVGKLLRDLGELPVGQGSMQGIRAWFQAHRDRFDEIADKNASKVFFAISSRPGAVGSQGVVLTPLRSMAIDRAFVAHSTPIWVDTRAPVAGARREVPWQRLLIAQDTGGGILGAVRGDIYWGADAAAAELSGRMGGPGRYWLLLPRAIRVSTPARVSVAAPTPRGN